MHSCTPPPLERSARTPIVQTTTLSFALTNGPSTTPSLTLYACQPLSRFYFPRGSWLRGHWQTNSSHSQSAPYFAFMREGDPEPGPVASVMAAWGSSGHQKLLPR